MEFENIVKLIKTVSDSNLTRFSYEESGLKINMKTDKEKNVVTTITPVSQNAMVSSAEAVTAQSQAPAQAPVNAGNVVKSPLVGTFYASTSPEEEPFVKVGDTVTKGQILGIVEAMKLMNEIESDYEGVIQEILVSNEAVVEFDQPMFVIV